MPRLYDSVHWRKLRDLVKREEPLCRMCLAAGRIVPSQVIDHIEPHHGNHKLFFNRENLQSLCKSCHDSRKALIENKGHSAACDVNGFPLDEGHPWREEVKKE